MTLAMPAPMLANISKVAKARGLTRTAAIIRAWKIVEELDTLRQAHPNRELVFRATPHPEDIVVVGGKL